MGLTGCCGIIKFLVILVNLLVLASGILIVGMAVWMITDPTFMLSMAQDEEQYYIGLYIFLAVGAVLLIVAFLGCCGAFRESQCMLVLFFCFLLVVLVADVAAGAWSYYNRNELNKMIESSVKRTVRDEYGRVESRTLAFDTIQKHFECCGAGGPSDWAASKYNGVEGRSILDLTISTVITKYKVPPSCCKSDIDMETCETSRSMGIGSSFDRISINRKGCLEKLVEGIENNMPILIGIGIAIVCIEILGLFFAMILCCAIRRNDHYKN